MSTPIFTENKYPTAYSFNQLEHGHPCFNLFSKLPPKQDVAYDTRVIINSHFVIKSAENQFDTWVPSVGDCLAEDWIMV